MSIIERVAELLGPIERSNSGVLTPGDKGAIPDLKVNAVKGSDVEVVPVVQPLDTRCRDGR